MKTDWHAHLVLNTPQHVALLGISSCAQPVLSIVGVALGPDDADFILHLAASLTPTTTASACLPTNRCIRSAAAPTPCAPSADESGLPQTFRACLATTPAPPIRGLA
jgi:hypothetical protein